MNHQEAPSAPPGPPRLLLIDDSPEDTAAVTGILRRHGHRVLEAASGDQGLRLARSYHPVLVLLDIHLPDIAGTILATALRFDPGTAAAPIVVITADRDARAREEIDAAGVDAVLYKPVSEDDLMRVVEKLLRDPPDHGLDEGGREGTPAVEAPPAGEEGVADTNLEREPPS